MIIISSPIIVYTIVIFIFRFCIWSEGISFEILFLFKVFNILKSWKFYICIYSEGF